MNTLNKIDSLIQAVDKVISRNDRLMDQIQEWEDAAIKPAAAVKKDDLAQIDMLRHTLICGKIETSRSNWRVTAIFLGCLLAISFAINIFEIFL